MELIKDMDILKEAIEIEVGSNKLKLILLSIVELLDEDDETPFTGSTGMKFVTGKQKP